MSSNNGKNKPIMLFDGDCGFCRHWVGKWRTTTGDKISYAPYQEALESYPQVTEEQCEKAVQLVLPGGEVYSGAHAVFKALSLAQKNSWLLWLYEHQPLFARAAEAFYQWVSRHRPYR